MTRRERHLRIIQNMGPRRVDWELRAMLSQNGVSILHDEAIEALAARLVRSLRHEAQMKKHTREHFAALSKAQA